MKKRLLFCGNGMSAEILEKLHNEYTIYVITEFINDRGLEYANKVVFANSKNPNEALQAAIDLYNDGYRFDAVLSLCWDCPMSVARIAEKFNLFGISYEVAENSTIKSIRSDIFYQNNIPAPKHFLCNSYQEVLIALEQLDFPIVLKPLSLSSSKGIVLVEDKESLFTSYNYCVNFDKNSQLLVNEFITGTEYSTEGLMINGNFYLTGISERVFHYKKYKPFFVEIGDIMPVNLNSFEIEQFRKITEKAALSLGIDKGIVKGDLIYTTDKQIKVFEITPRLGGPRFGTEMVPLSNGTNLLLAAIQQALGEKIDMENLKPKYRRGLVNKAIFPKEGIIDSIEGIEYIKTLPGYYDFKWLKDIPLKKGDVIEKAENMCGGVGYIIATGKNREDAILNANLIEKNIHIKTH